MGFLESIKRGLRLIKLDGSAAIEIAENSNSTLYGWIIIIVVGLIVAFTDILIEFLHTLLMYLVYW